MGRILEKPVEIVLAYAMKSITFTSMGSRKQGFRFKGIFVMLSRVEKLICL
jgi:hypothetical protein